MLLLTLLIAMPTGLTPATPAPRPPKVGDRDREREEGLVKLYTETRTTGDAQLIDLQEKFEPFAYSVGGFTHGRWVTTEVFPWSNAVGVAAALLVLPLLPCTCAGGMLVGLLIAPTGPLAAIPLLAGACWPVWLGEALQQRFIDDDRKRAMKKLLVKAKPVHEEETRREGELFREETGGTNPLPRSTDF